MMRCLNGGAATARVGEQASCEYELLEHQAARKTGVVPLMNALIKLDVLSKYYQ